MADKNSKKSFLSGVAAWIAANTLGVLLRWIMAGIFIILLVAGTIDYATSQFLPIDIAGFPFGQPTNLVGGAAGMILAVLGKVVEGFLLQLLPALAGLLALVVVWKVFTHKPKDAEGHEGPAVWRQILDGFAEQTYRGGRRATEEAPRLARRGLERVREERLRRRIEDDLAAAPPPGLYLRIGRWRIRIGGRR